MSTGKCDPDIAGCAAGTVQMGDQCIPIDDSLVGDIQEPAEPNDPGSGGEGTLTLPAVGSSTTIEGCVTPTADTNMNGNLDPDLDTYVFTATGPMVLDITVDGLGGLAGGFQLVSAEQALIDAGWLRFGLTMVGDTARRKVFVPGAGTYALVIGDSRSFLTGEGAGDANTCYFATVTAEAIPTATPVTAGTAVTGAALGDLQVYSYDPGEGAIIFNTLVANSESLAGGMVVMINDNFQDNAALGSLGDDADTFAGGLRDNDNVIIVVDYIISYGLSGVPFQFDVYDPGALAAPMDGSAVSVSTDSFNFRWLYFDVNDGEVVYMDVNTNSGDSVIVDVLDTDYNFITSPCGGTLTTGGCDQWDGWVQFVSAGRYYIRLFNNEPPPANCGDGTVDADEQCDDGNTDDNDGCTRQCNTEPYTFDVHVTRNHTTPGVLAVGTPATGQTLTNDTYGFHELDVSSSEWLRFQATPTGFTGDVTVHAYDRSVAGELGVDITADTTFSLADSSAEAGRIVIGNMSTYLLRVGDAGGTGTGKTYDFDVANRTFTDLGTVTDTAPVTITGATLAADETKYFLARAASGYLLDFTITGGTGIDPVLDHIDDEESSINSYDANTGAATSEMFTARVGPDGWVAFTLEDVAGAAGTVDGGVTGTAPVTYTSTAGTLPFTDICSMGSAHALSDGDDGLSTTPITLPSAFTFYGVAETGLIVSSNGWASFDTSLTSSFASNSTIPTSSGPNGLLAGYWDDLDAMAVCTYHDTTNNTYTVQWIGATWISGADVEFQVRLNYADNSIDIIYGVNHAVDGSSGTAGVEDQFGDFGTELFHNTSALTVPVSYTLTPN